MKKPKYVIDAENRVKKAQTALKKKKAKAAKARKSKARKKR